MSRRFWGTSSKSVPNAIQIDDLAWFENSILGGAVILGIFRDAIAMSQSSYIKQIAEKSLGIIKSIATAGFDNTALRIDLQKLGEATAAVTATILQSYLESANRDGWPGSQLRSLLEDLIKILDTIEVWILTGHTKSSFGRRKCVKVIKQFQQRLSEVLERFELASLLQSYTVLPFIKKMVEEYARSLDAGAERQQQSSTNADDLSKGLPEPGVVEKEILNLDGQQKYREEKETLRVKVRLILGMIEKEERSQHTPLEESVPANHITTNPNQYPREKEHRVPEQDEPQLGNPGPEAGKMAGDHAAKLEQAAIKLLYDMLMARVSNAAIFGPNPQLRLVEQPKISLSSSLPPNQSSVNNVRGQNVLQEASQVTKDDNNSRERPLNHQTTTSSDRLSLEKPNPSLEPVDTHKSPIHQGSISDVRGVEQAHYPFKPVHKSADSRSIISLPPGAMAPIVGTASPFSYDNGLYNGSGRTYSRSLPPDTPRPERSLSVTPLPVGEELEEETERRKNLESPPPEEVKKPMRPLSPEVKESTEVSRPLLSADGDPAKSSNQQVPVVIRPITKPSLNGDTGKEKHLINSGLRSFDMRRPFNASPYPMASRPGVSTTTKIRMRNSPPPLPPGAMPPRLSSWSLPPALPQPAFSKVKEIPPGHRLPGPGPTINSIAQSSSSSSNKNLALASQSSNPNFGRHPGLTLNGNTLQPTHLNSGGDNMAESVNYHLPPIPIASPITLAPLLVVEPRSFRISTPQQPPPPPPVGEKPKTLGPGYEYLRKMSPHMQRYIERLADLILVGSEGGR